MTIYHPRVGFDIVEVNAGGINDPNDATVVPINVGKTFILPSPAVGWLPSSGTWPGGIQLGAAGAGDEISYRIASNNIGVRLYLPAGDSLSGSGGAVTNFTLGAFASYYGQTVRMTKVNATEWAVW